jgi:hypothetical protein
VAAREAVAVRRSAIAFTYRASKKCPALVASQHKRQHASTRLKAFINFRMHFASGLCTMGTQLLNS